ncbi:MAG TPA: TetR family transcriptional regulator [Acidimicrobiales bacterium]|nr:TetR family transcriptional regulator [Acidimicrobiales bacterium]
MEHVPVAPVLPVARELRKSQMERRHRVIEAAMALGAEGGYEAVQMRDVAAKADVALGTVYRYFESKDHLLAAALAYWMGTMGELIARMPTIEGTTGDRVSAVLGRATTTMSRQPKLVAALLAPLSSSDPGVVECQEQVAQMMDDLVRRAAGDDPPADIGDRARMLGHIWYSTLLGWVNGWTNVGVVRDEIAVACGLLF